MPIEKPVISGRPTRLAFLKEYILSLILLLMVLVIIVTGMPIFSFAIYLAIALAIFFIFLVEFNRLRNKYEITQSQVIVQEGMVSKRRMSVFMDNISDVNVKQGYFQRLLNYGRVIVGSASGRDYMELEMKVRKPQDLAHKIERLIKAYTKI